MTNSYRPYPRRLYLNGEVLPNDPHATNSVVVESAEAEEDARSKGYRKAWEHLPKFGGNGGGSTLAVVSPPAQDGAAPVSAGPVGDTYTVPADSAGGTIQVLPADDVEALRAECIKRGLKPHHRAGVDKLREMLDGAAA